MGLLYEPIDLCSKRDRIYEAFGQPCGDEMVSEALVGNSNHGPMWPDVVKKDAFSQKRCQETLVVARTAIQDVSADSLRLRKRDAVAVRRDQRQTEQLNEPPDGAFGGREAQPRPERLLGDVDQSLEDP